MPATYAHYRFGREVLGKLGGDIRKKIEKEEKLYLIGLHGPDILFYYRPLGKNKINQFGHNMHKRTGQDVFSEMFEREEEISGRQKEAVQAYIYGFLCHFALDRCCHPFVEEWIRKSGVSHIEIEAEFDRALMIHDGFHPLLHKPAGHITSGSWEAEAIRRMFPDFSVKELREALVSAKAYNHLFVAPGPTKRGLIKGALKVFGKSEELSGLLINFRSNEACRESTRRLIHLYRQAVPMAAGMVAEMGKAFEEGVFLPGGEFDHTFGAQ